MDNGDTSPLSLSCANILDEYAEHAHPHWVHCVHRVHFRSGPLRPLRRIAMSFYSFTSTGHGLVLGMVEWCWIARLQGMLAISVFPSQHASLVTCSQPLSPLSRLFYCKFGVAGLLRLHPKVTRLVLRRCPHPRGKFRSVAVYMDICNQDSDSFSLSLVWAFKMVCR